MPLFPKIDVLQTSNITKRANEVIARCQPLLILNVLWPSLSQLTPSILLVLVLSTLLQMRNSAKGEDLVTRIHSASSKRHRILLPRRRSKLSALSFQTLFPKLFRTGKCWTSDSSSCAPGVVGWSSATILIGGPKRLGLQYLRLHISISEAMDCDAATATIVGAPMR
jgi:hypothetical protein